MGDEVVVDDEVIVHGSQSFIHYKLLSHAKIFFQPGKIFKKTGRNFSNTYILKLSMSQHVDKNMRFEAVLRFW